jgi:hypothetical protein
LLEGRKRQFVFVCILISLEVGIFISADNRRNRELGVSICGTPASVAFSPGNERPAGRDMEIVAASEMRSGLRIALLPTSLGHSIIEDLLGRETDMALRHLVSLHVISGSIAVSRLSRRMWDPRRLTTLRGSTACCRDRFTVYLTDVPPTPL